MYTKGELLRLAQGFTHEHSIFGTILIAFGGRDYAFEESVRELEEMLDDLYQASGIEGIYWGTVLEGSKTMKNRAKPGDKVFFLWTMSKGKNKCLHKHLLSSTKNNYRSLRKEDTLC